MSGLLWPALLLLVAIAMLGLEALIPSGGLLGFLALAAFVSSVVIAYLYGGAYVGTGFLAGSTIVLVAVAALLVRLWPLTPIGRRILIPPRSEDEIVPNRWLRDLVGKRGVALSPMLPSGAIRVDGRTYDAVSDGKSIDPGTPIKVVAVRANHLVVRPAPSEEPPVPEEAGGDILSQPVDSIIPDPFDDPLA